MKMMRLRASSTYTDERRKKIIFTLPKNKSDTQISVGRVGKLLFHGEVC